MGEITAIVEMCVWLHHQVISKAISSSNHSVIHIDSSYARNILLGKWAARQNKTLCMLAKVLLHRLMTLIPVHLVWVRGHSGTYGNEKADSLATDDLDPFLRVFNHCRDPIFGNLSWGILQKLSKHEPLKSHVERLASAVHATDAVAVPISALTVALSQAAINVNERYSGGCDFVPAGSRSTFRGDLEVLERRRRCTVDSADRHPMNREIF